MYKFLGVPRAFETRDQALSFLTHSPGYVRRRKQYLATYWPGLLADVAAKKPMSPRATSPRLAAEQASLRARSRKLRGDDDGLPELAGAVVSKAGRWAKDQARQTADAVLYGGGGTSRGSGVPGVAQRVSRVSETLVPSPRTVEATSDLLLGKGLTNLAQGQGPKNWEDVAGLGAGLAMAGVPVFKGPKAGVAALRAAARGEDAAQAAKVAYQAGGPLKSAVRALRPKPRERVLEANDFVQDFYTARSRVTRTLVEDNYDRLSKALMGEGPVARAGRATPLVKNAAADMRVAKEGGMQVGQVARQAQARMQAALRALPVETQGMPGSRERNPVDIAHFWYRQLPPNLRNAEGLKLVRAEQAKTLRSLVDGTAQKALEQRLGAVKAAMGQVEWATPEFSRLLKESGDIKTRLDDIRPNVEELTSKLERLDSVIAQAPKADPKILAGMDRVGDDTTRTLIDAGVLDPGVAAVQGRRVADWLGVEPTGAEGYVGHRLAKTKNVRMSGLPGRGTGRPRPPKGIGKQNKRVLISTGRVRDSTQVMADDWANAQIFRNGLRARDESGRMGTRFDPGRIPENVVVINTKGKLIPPQWKPELEALRTGGRSEDEIGQRVADLLRETVERGDEGEIRAMGEGMTDGFMADTPEKIQAMLENLPAGQSWQDLRVVKKEVADRYFAQFTPAGAGTVGGSLYDSMVDYMAASLIFGRLGYIPKNFVQNLVMAVPHQGIYLAANFPRALQAMLDPDLFPLLNAEVGFTGPTQQLGSEFRHTLKGAPHWLAGKIGGVADTPLRISALLHEAAAEGVIPRYSTSLTAKDKQSLLDLYSPGRERLANTVRKRSVEAMANFGRLTPTQTKWVRKFLIIPGWLWAGSRYPVHFAATHPGRAAAIGYVAAGEPGAPEQFQVNRPVTDYMAEGVPEWSRGIETPWGVQRTNSLSPVQTPIDVANAVASRDGQAVGDFVNPVGAAVYNIAKSQVDSPTGTFKTGQGEAVQRNLERLAPNVGLVRDLVSPGESKYYPEDTTRLGRLKREVGVLPIEINRNAAGGGGPPGKRAWRVVFEERNEVLAAARKTFGMAELPDDLKQAYNLKAKVEEARALARKQHPSGVEYKREAFRREARLAQQLGLVSKQNVDEAVKAAATADEATLEKWLGNVRKLWADQYGLINTARNRLEEQGVVLEHGR